MSSVSRTLPRKLTATLVATAIVLGSAALFLDRAQAGSSVTPTSGPQGKTVVGTYGGKTKSLVTMLFRVQMNGTDSFMFCIDISTLIEFGVSYDEASWSTSNVPNLGEITRILSLTNATSTKDPVEIAAAQAAIWHYSDGFELAAKDTRNDPAVVARYAELVAAAAADPVESEPAGTLSVTPESASATTGQPLFYEIATTATAPLTLETSDPAVSVHPAEGDVCRTDQVIATVTGNARVCLTTRDPRQDVKLTVRTPSAQVAAGRVFIRPGRQKLIIGRSATAQSAEVVSATWTTNGAPKVSVSCPAGGVRFGQAATFTAAATDPDGDPLTYLWTLNGTIVGGETSSSITIALQRRDVLTVTVSDAGGATASATADCAGDNPPTVLLSCPSKLQLGGLNTFVAVGEDPDGDALTYQWSLNGTPLQASTGDTVSVEVDEGDVLAVVAVDETGKSSASAVAGCLTPNQPPTVTISCPEDLVVGRPAVSTAAGSDPEGGPLTYRWYVDGELQPDQTADRATLVVRAGQKVAVEAVDGPGKASTRVEAACTAAPENRPPTVTIACPDDLVWGTPATFEASASDPDGDSVTYAWTLDGRPLAGQQGASVTVTLDEGSVLAVTVTDGRGAASDAVRADCPGRPANQPPTVELECPEGLVYGEATTFTATGSDPDGDALTYVWFVDGTEVAGQRGPTAELAVEEGQRVAVQASDGTVTSDVVAVVCPGTRRNRPPVVSVECPDRLVAGEEATWIANAADPDGDVDLLYRWYVDGAAVPNLDGPRATLTLAVGQRLTVTATDGDGATSAEAEADCPMGTRPTVALSCPEDLVFGEPATFVATGDDVEDGELTYVWKVGDRTVEDESGPTVSLTLARGDVVSVTVLDADGLASEVATSTCVGTARPTVELACPAQLVLGEPATFVATGADRDGDSLTYRWSVDGTEVADQRGPRATLTLTSAQQRVSVVAVDPTGTASAAVTADCTGRPRPTVSLACPSGVVVGKPATYAAVGSVTDGSSLAFTWAVDGVAVADQHGPTASLTVGDGGRVSVNARSTNGLTSATVTVACGTTPPPTTPPPIPPAPEVLGSRIVAAIQPAAATALAYTGGSPLGLVVVATAGLVLGGLVLVVARRRTAAAR